MANEKIINLDNLKKFRQEYDTRIKGGAIEVGRALVSKQIENINDEVGSTQTAPFLFQATGTDNNTTETPTAPVAKHLELRGNTVKWNQLVRYYERTVSGVQGTYLNGVYTLNGISTAEQSNTYLSYQTKRIAGHKYLWVVRKIGGTIDITGRTTDNQNGYYIGANLPLLSPNKVTLIDNETHWQIVDGSTDSNEAQYFRIAFDEGVDFANAQFICMCFDLTDIYGAGNEPSDYLSFVIDYPLPYYAYDSGTLKSCNSSKLVTIVCNQLSGLEQGLLNNSTGLIESSLNSIRSKDFIKVIQGQTYKIDGYNNVSSWDNGLYLYMYDANKNYLGRKWLCDSTGTNEYKETKTKFELNIGVQYIKIVFANNTSLTYTGEEKVMVRLSWNESHDYVDYVKHEYNLPQVELRSADSVYDTITPNGVHTQRIGFTDNISDLVSNVASENGVIQFDATSLGIKANSDYSVVSNLLSNKYVKSNYNGTYSATVKNSIAFVNNTIAIQDDNFIGLTLEQLKTYLAEVTLQFELEAPVISEVSSFTENIEVDDFGTMEFVPSDSTEEVVVPQGNKFFYPADYVLFIDDMYNHSKDGGEVADVGNFVTQSELTQAISEIPTPDLTQIESNVAPKTNNAYDLGSSSNKWRNAFFNAIGSTNSYASNIYSRNLWISNALFNGAGSNFGITVPSTVGFSADKEIATTDYFGFRILTAAQFQALSGDERSELISTYGCRVIGLITISASHSGSGTVNIRNPIFFPCNFAGYNPPNYGTSRVGTLAYNDPTEYEKCYISSYLIQTNLSNKLSINTLVATGFRNIGSINNIPLDQYYKKPQSSVSLSDGGTITDDTLKSLIQNEQPIKLNGFTCYFSCDDGTNYQYVSTRYDSSANKNHINVITIDKSTWVATFHTSDIAV